MKRIWLMLVAMLLVTVVAAFAADKVENPKACEQCGMDRSAFANSRMTIIYADGTSFGTCSLHCAASAMMENKGKKVKALKVADYTTGKLIDAERATWVVGGKQPGVMTSLPKWAFASVKNAHKFARENGGKVTTFDEALNLALKEK